MASRVAPRESELSSLSWDGSFLLPGSGDREEVKHPYRSLIARVEDEEYAPQAGSESGMVKARYGGWERNAHRSGGPKKAVGK